MKKLLNTLPSTKPDHIYSSQQSQASFQLPRKQIYQQQIQALLITMRSFRKLRYFFFLRDIEEIFKANEKVLSDLLGVYSAQQLWDMFVPEREEELKQQSQINLLLRLLLQLNRRKQRQGDCGNIAVFDQHRSTIQWLIPQIVAYEKQLRQKIEVKMLQACESQKQRRQNQFARYEMKVKEQFQQMEQIRQGNLALRLRIQSQYKDKQIDEKVQRDMHKFKASKLLKDAKDTALLQKLAPYRWEKKRPYEDHTYKAQLSQTIELDNVRKMRVIDNLKRAEKDKLKKAQQTLISTQQMHAETLREKMLIQLASERSQLSNHEERVFRNLKHSVDMVNNHRVVSLRKSLEAFSKHEDTLKIKQIIKDHTLKVQFNNDIETIAKPQADAHELSSRYCTINTDRACSKLERTIDRHQKRLQRRVKGLLGDDQFSSTMSSGRRSLVDLYDDSLNRVQ